MSGSVTKDAFWQILGRFLSAISWFVVTLIMTKLFGPLRYGDYSTVLSYFALRSALADLWLYVLALKEIWWIKKKYGITDYTTRLASTDVIKEKVSTAYSQFVISRTVQILAVYGFALLIAYFIPSYRENIYIARWLPLGMLFSASFLIASIIQLPLQLFRRMHHVTIALTLARVAQLAILWAMLIYVMAQWWFEQITTVSLWLFLIWLGSVLISGIVQVRYTLYQSTRIIHLRWVSFWEHFTSRIRNNRQYGIAYFLSSFHLLLWYLCVSIYYPTTSWYTYTGTWWLALSLMQILLIIPASFANSILPKITHESLVNQKKIFWKLMLIMIRTGIYCALVFTIFGSLIIRLISSTKYLSWEYLLSRNGINNLIHSVDSLLLYPYGSDYLLPFLWWVLILSFIKTIYNYVLISHDKQNTLLWINLWWCAIGAPITRWMILEYHIAGAAVSQLIMELAFVYFSYRYTKQLNLTPLISLRQSVMIWWWSILCVLWWLYVVDWIYEFSLFWQSVCATLICLAIALPRYIRLKRNLSTLVD